MRISDWSSDVCSYDLGKSELRRLKIDRSLVDPTDDEIHDNIVAFWVPRDAAEAGKRYRLRYRLHWQADEPYPAESARVMATRIGRGGQPGKPRPPGLVKFVVAFDGGRPGKLPREQAPEPNIQASRREISPLLAYR